MTELTMTEYTPTKAPWSIRGLVATGALDEAGASLLGEAAAKGHSILICGPGGSGRSTLLMALAQSLTHGFVLHSHDQGTLGVPGFSASSATGQMLPTVVEASALAEEPLARVAVSSRRSASGALAEVADLWVSGTRELAVVDAAHGLSRAAQHYDLVVTCGRRAVEVDGRQVKRRVVVKVEAVEGVDQDGDFKLAPLLTVADADAGDWDETAGGEVFLARQRILKEHNRTLTSKNFFSTAHILHGVPSEAGSHGGLTAVLAKVASYGGPSGALAADLLLISPSGSSDILAPLQVHFPSEPPALALLDAIGIMAASGMAMTPRVTELFRQLRNY